MDTKKYPKQKTARMLETSFDAEEIPGKINNKSVRYMALPTLKLDKPNTRKDKMKEAPLHRITIPGPPGTGKTHRLMGYLDEELKKLDPENSVHSFSNAAANVARDRIKNDKNIRKHYAFYGDTRVWDKY